MVNPFKEKSKSPHAYMMRNTGDLSRHRKDKVYEASEYEVKSIGVVEDSKKDNWFKRLYNAKN